MQNHFRDRTDAGVQLARSLQRYLHCPGLVILALPRGGVPVAFEVARALHAPLDVLVARKLGAPLDPELAIGAIAPRGVLYLNHSVLRGMRISQAELSADIERARKELVHRETLYRGGRQALDLKGKVVIVVDDGLATGSSMHAALESVRAAEPARMVVAVPVARAGAAESFAGESDDFVCLLQPDSLYSIGRHYVDFTQVSDATVCELMDLAYRSGAAADSAASNASTPSSGGSGAAGLRGSER
ncbi:MAG TPA: phosphoribosyltransferase [Paraburkholderia sp.]|jgi:putative phosphoribosyl transferase|nr:phosphoribosyltransferase [Paraburkholderia sp.]